MIGFTNQYVNIFCKLDDGATNQYPQAKIYDWAGNVIETINLSHQASGIYASSWVTSVATSYKVEYIIYSDAGRTIKNSNYNEMAENLLIYDIHPTSAQIADAVWDETSAGHTGGGKAGDQLWTDIDAIKTKTDLLSFTGTDVKATLDGEQVVVSTNNDKTGYTISGTTQTLDTLYDSLKAIGNANWATATGFSTHSAADVADAVWNESKVGHTGDLKTMADRIDQALSTTESNIRGADNDSLKDLSDQIDTVNTTANRIDSTCSFIYNVERGGWTRSGGSLTFYKPDNTTVIESFALFKQDGTLAGDGDAVYRRKRV
jgi:hypothetical protein